jgi:hypothetical protein
VGARRLFQPRLRVHAVTNIPDVRKEYLDNFARISERGGKDDAYETGGT